MIDWVKMSVNTADSVNKILESPHLNFYSEANVKTGELIEFPKKGKSGAFEFKAYSPSFAIIMGSIHKYYHNGVNNTDFNIEQLKDAIHRFCSNYGLSASDLLLHNLEYGVNIETKISASSIMRDILCYKNRLPIRPIDDDRGFFIEFKMSDYYLKVYDKAKQYGNVNNMLRVEVKAVKSRGYSYAGIKTLEDLLAVEKVRQLSMKHINVFRSIVFDDSINKKLLDEAEISIYETLRNPRIWEQARRGKTRESRKKESRFIEIISRVGEYKHSMLLERLIREKWEKLFESNEDVLA